MNSNKKATWHILGAGSIGLLWAAWLRQSGHRVITIGRQSHDSPRTLTINSERGTFSHQVDYLTAMELNTPINHLLIATKAQDTLQAFKNIDHCISDTCKVLLVQNGMAGEELITHFPNILCYAAITTDGAYRTSAFDVVHAGIGKTSIGCISQHDDDDSILSLLHQLPCDYLNIEACDDVKQQQWKKLSLNCVINGLTAIYNCQNGDLLAHSQAHEHLMRLCNETYNITHTIQPSLYRDTSHLYNDVAHACTITAQNYSSMHQDIKHHRNTEIDFLNGYLCQQADKLHITCSENRKVVNAIKQLENKE